MPAPTLNVSSTSFSATTGTKTMAATWNAGDLLVVLGTIENNNSVQNQTITTPTVTGLTFSSIDLDTLDGGTHCWGGSWSATAASSGSGNISVTNTSTSLASWGCLLIIASAGTHNGTGSHTRANNTSLTTSLTVSANSAVAELIADWGAGSTTGYTYTPASGTDQAAGNVSGHYTWYGATWTGLSAGASNYGVSGITSSGSQYTKIAVEILAGADVSATIPLNWVNGVNSP